MHITDLSLVVGRVEHEVGEALELRQVAFRHMSRPGLFEPVDGRRFERYDYRHQRVERVQLV